MAMATAEQRAEAEGGGEAVYRTKVIEFLGRKTPIILQNDNGPCPLIAICNVLLLKNEINLNLDASEVSQQQLLALVAEKLLDSNSNTEGKDEGYVKNQQQSIADVLDLIPRLATGIDVNLQFTKFNHFEYTRERSLFDLLGIDLYHGWIVDPQDTDTAAAIGSKSYNRLLGELVAFESRKSEGKNTSILDEDSVDFAAATTAALGVPSPCLSRGRSFDDCSVFEPVEQSRGIGDREEAEDILRALNLSKTEMSTTVMSMPSDTDWSNSSLSSQGSTPMETSGSGTSANSLGAENGDRLGNSQPSALSAIPERKEFSDWRDDSLNSEAIPTESGSLFPHITTVNNMTASVPEKYGESLISNNSMENARTDTSQIQHMPAESQTVDSAAYSAPSSSPADLDASNGREELPDISDVVSSSVEGNEPIYEGEDCILDSGLPKFEDREPIYEGEVVLAEQADKVEEDTFSVDSKDKVAQQQWDLIKNFLENNKSQLTIHGLFSLQAGLQKRELCVFFRNNHFSTMFKFDDGQLYLLATDQGYMNQPDLVWEKLNEVNGDTIFVTGHFTEFRIENQVNASWNEENAMTSTADYLATLEDSAPSNSSMNSDLRLAIQLQQQEFEQQPQRQQQQISQQPLVSGRSRLVTGPQVPRSSAPPQKTESKAKEKCSIM